MQLLAFAERDEIARERAGGWSRIAGGVRFGDGIGMRSGKSQLNVGSRTRPSRILTTVLRSPAISAAIADDNVR